MASVIPSPPLGADAAADRPTGLGADAVPPARARSRVGEGVSPETATAVRRFRFELAAHPGSPAQARRLTRARLTGWSVCEDTCDSAALVVSELVTNAIVHTASHRVVCELHDGDDLVRIAVRDEGCASGEPHPSPQRPEEEQGRGLLLVEALCHAWGAHEHGPGLLVWADLPRKADTPRDDADVPRNDLGWGARPKPGPSGGSGEDDEAEAHHRAVPDTAAPGNEARDHEARDHEARDEARDHETGTVAVLPARRGRDRGGL
nr:ATP-binding protein [Streptomyces resistomycificus]